MKVCHRDDLDYPYLVMMDELLTEIIEYARRARNAQGDVAIGIYLRMLSRTARCALEIYGDRLEQNRIEVQLGEIK